MKVDLLAPVEITETSVTERSTFRTCRRQWFLGTVKRYEQAGGSPFFWFGNLIHYALEHYYLWDTDERPESTIEFRTREEFALAAFESYATDTLKDLKHELGFLWDSAKDEYDSMVEMGRGMLDGYFRMEKETGGFGKVVAVEERFRVPIRGPSGRILVGRPQLTGRFDLIIEKPNGDIWVIDHKTATQKHNSAHLDLDDQLTGYAYVFWRATGVMPRGQVYNVLLKKVPGPPRLLKNGTLSVAKDQSTTYSLYLEALQANGLNRNEYAEMLSYLKDKGWDDFYIQEGVFRNKAQLAAFEHDLYFEWRDMRATARRPETAYPNPSPFACPSCPVKMICQTMQDGGDTDAIITQQFHIAPPRR